MSTKCDILDGLPVKEADSAKALIEVNIDALNAEASLAEYQHTHGFTASDDPNSLFHNPRAIARIRRHQAGTLKALLELIWFFPSLQAPPVSVDPSDPKVA